MMEEGFGRVHEGEDPNGPELTKLHKKTMNKIRVLEIKCKEKSIDICSVFKLAHN